MEGGERRWHVPDLIVPFCMMICSRCHGTLPGCPCWQALWHRGSSLHAWHAVSRRPERSGGFLWRWEHRLQRPSIRASLRARHPMLSASFDESGKPCRRRPHLYDGVLRRPGIFSGRLHQHQSLGVTLHRQSVYPSLSPAPSGGVLAKRGQLTRPSFGVLRTFGASRVPGSLPVAEVPRYPQAQSLALGMCQLLPQS